MRLQVFTFILLLSQALSGSELRQGTDPISGEKYTLEKHQVGEWEVYTPPKHSESLLMVVKEGKPVVTSTLFGKGRSITVHNKGNSAPVPIEIHDLNGDGTYDRMFIYQEKGGGYIEAKLIEGRWQFTENN